jgi:hypothetical protein
MMKAISHVIMAALMIGSSVVYAGQGPGTASVNAVTTAPQSMLQSAFGRPAIAADGINNASQVDDPTEIGRSGMISTDAPDPILLEGGAGVLEAK